MRRIPALALCSAMMAAMPAAAAEVSYDFVACTHGVNRVLEGSPELTALGSESWGIVASSTTKEWESATTRCVGHLRIAGGKTVGKGLCRWVQSSGDTALGEWEMTPSGENTWTWLYGTGKLAGIRGSGTFQWAARGRPAEAGTGQSCRRDWGKYTLP